MVQTPVVDIVDADRIENKNSERISTYVEIFTCGIHVSCRAILLEHDIISQSDVDVHRARQFLRETLCAHTVAPDGVC